MGVRLSGLLVVLDGFADLVVGFDFRTVHERERNTASTIVTLSSTDFAGWRPISILLQVGTEPRWASTTEERAVNQTGGCVKPLKKSSGHSKIRELSEGNNNASSLCELARTLA